MLTEEEKWHFDIQGYLVLRNAVSPEDVARMRQLADEWHALEESELPPPLWTYRDASTKPTSPRSIFQAKKWRSEMNRKGESCP